MNGQTQMEASEEADRHEWERLEREVFERQLTKKGTSLGTSALGNASVVKSRRFFIMLGSCTMMENCNYQPCPHFWFSCAVSEKNRGYIYIYRLALIHYKN